MKTKLVNDYLEKFYKLFNEIEELSLKQGIKELTKTELHVIEAIGKSSVYMNELSEKLGITMGTATVAINKLEAKGFIERSRCEEDRRRVSVKLSNQGLIAYDYHTNFHKNMISEITKSLTEKELDTFVKIFEKILLNLQEQVILVKPKNITEFSEKSTVKITEICGTPATKKYFDNLGLSLKKDVEILDKDKEKIIIFCNNEEIEISCQDAKNINGVLRK